MKGRDDPKLREILVQATELPPERRAAFLDSACAGNVELRAEIESLLHFLEAENQLLREPSVAMGAMRSTTVDAPRPTNGERQGSQIGRYKLLEQIGEGGFGVVFMAEQRDPVRRMVALKIIKLGMDTKKVIARFEAERQALAMMDHPNIAKVLDGGITETGRPYFVMELVRGVPITAFCDENKLTTRQRLELFVPICSALQHAHQKGIIHRDLKPGNVLVTMHDDKPVPKIIDFGVAKAINQRLTEHTLFTEFRQLIGTPAYMSPEQAQMSGLDVDTRSDIYSLGVLLYELLTGATPFDPQQLRSAAYEEMQRIIREVEPPRPSTRLSTLAAGTRSTVADHRRCDPATLGRTLEGDLDWIIMKCLEKDRCRRYETANGLARDIQRYLDDEPVEASPPSATYKLRKLIRRRKREALSVMVVAGALVLGFIGTSIGLTQARRNLAKAREAENRLSRENRLAMENAARAQQAEQRASVQREKAERSAAAEKESRQAAELNLANSLIAQGDAQGGMQNWPEAKARYRQAMELLKSQGQPTFLAQVALWDANRRSPGPLLELNAHEGGVTCVRFLPGGAQVATAGRDGFGRIWETRTGRLIRSFPGLGDVQQLSVSPDGATIAFASMTKGVTLWGTQNGKLVRTLNGFSGRASAVCFSSGLPRLLIGTADAPYDIYLFDAESGQLLRTFGGSRASVRDIAFTPDCSKAVSCTGRAPDDDTSNHVDASLTVWNVTSGIPLWHRMVDLNARLAGALAVSPDGDTIACTCWDGEAKVCDTMTGMGQTVVDSARGGSDAHGVAFSSDRVLAVGGPSGSIRLLRAGVAYGGWLGKNSWVEFRRLGGHAGMTRTLDFSRDGRVLASGGRDGMVRLWPVYEGGEAEVFTDITHRNIPEIFCVSISPDELMALSSSDEDRLIRLWDVKSKTEVNSLGTLSGRRTAAQFGPDNRTIVLVESNGRIGIWDRRLSRRLRLVNLPADEKFVSIALSFDGRTLLAAPDDSSSIDAYDLGSGRLLGRLSLGLAHKRDRVQFTFSPDGRFVAGSDLDGDVVKIWDAVRWSERLRITVPRPWRVVVSPDSKSIACIGADVRVFDSNSGSLTNHFIPEADTVGAVGFLSERYLITEGAPSEGLVLWDLDRHARVRSLSEGNFNFDLALAKDGTVVWSQRARRNSVAGALNIAHLNWVETNDRLAAELASSRPRLQNDSSDPEALGTLAEWYAFRGMYDWASAMLEGATERAPLTVAETELLATCRLRLKQAATKPAYTTGVR